MNDDNWSIRDERRRARTLKLLDASRPFLEDAPIGDVARELVKQALDIVEPDERGAVVVDALRSLWEDENACGTTADE